MGLACTLLGHRYGDVELEHDREERGEEAVIVTREVATCERCGQEHVLSESTEVTSIVDPDDVGVDTDADVDPEADDEADADATDADTPSQSRSRSGSADAGAGEDDGAAPEGSASGPAEGDAAARGSSSAALDPDPDPDEEDAVILEEGESDDGRDYGEWPDTDVDVGDVGDPGDAGADDRDDETEAAAREAEERVFEEIDHAADVPDALVCPDCGFRTEAAGTPLRAGDACPDCGDAYLAAKGSGRSGASAREEAGADGPRDRDAGGRDSDRSQ